MEILKSAWANGGLFLRALAGFLISLPLILKLAYVAGQAVVLRRIKEITDKKESE